jgi:hypothetical protein
MGAVLNKRVGEDGVLAFQDDKDPNMFHYMPSRIDAILGETLRTMKVTYYGISKTPYYVDTGNQNYQSCVGGVLSGQAIPDITAPQRKNITKAISEKYPDVKNLNLVPLMLREVEIQPVFAQNLIPSSPTNSTFPKDVQFGNQFNYSVSSGNSLFATMVGGINPGMDENPDFGINISGETDFYGDPWEAKITCDLSQVWNYTRTKVSAGLQLGWLNVGVDVDAISQELIKNNIIKMEYKEGSGGDKFGMQLLESTRTVFEAISALVTKGEGLFRFEPNPEPQELPSGDSWGAQLLPWSMSINTAYASNYFNQTNHFEQTVKFTGKVIYKVTASMNLAVTCNSNTADLFLDLQLGKNGCATISKTEGLQARMQAESAAKSKKIAEYFKKLEDGIYTPEQYATLLKILNTINLTESAKTRISANGEIVISPMTLEEALAELVEIEQQVLAPSYS